MGSNDAVVAPARARRGPQRSQATAGPRRLFVGAADDGAEVEADRVAERVTASISWPWPAAASAAPSKIRRRGEVVAHQASPPPAIVDGLADYLPRLPPALLSMAGKLLDAVRRGDLRISAQQAKPLLALFRALCNELAGAEEGEAVDANGAPLPGGMIAIADVVAGVLGTDVTQFLDGEDMFVPLSWLLENVPEFAAPAGGAGHGAAELDGSEPALPTSTTLLGLPAPTGEEPEEETEDVVDAKRPKRRVPVGNVFPTTLPPVLVAGMAGDEHTGHGSGAQLPGEASATREMQQIVDAAVAAIPAAAPAIQRLQIRELRNIRHKARTKVERTTKNEDAGDDAYFDDVVQRFRTNVQAELENTWIAGNADQAKAGIALARAKLDPTKNPFSQATLIYNHLYTPLAFADAAIAVITAASAEQPLLNLHGTIPAPDWAAFLVAATSTAPLLAFALANAANLAGVPSTAKVVQCWHANPVVLTSVVDCQNLLALNLVNDELPKALVAVALLGTTQIPDLPALTALVNTTLFDSIRRIRTVAALGGDVECSARMLALPGDVALKDTELQTFNATAGPTVAEAVQCWNDLTLHVADDATKLQLIRSLVKAPNATRNNFISFVTNFGTLSDRETVSSTRVATLVNCGLLIPRGSAYTSKKYGKGAVYGFEFAGQGRLFPEWHIHFEAAGGKGAKTVGAGWKNKNQKKMEGVKTFTEAGDNSRLKTCITDAGRWLQIII